MVNALLTSQGIYHFTLSTDEKYNCHGCGIFPSPVTIIKTSENSFG